MPAFSQVFLKRRMACSKDSFSLTLTTGMSFSHSRQPAAGWTWHLAPDSPFLPKKKKAHSRCPDAKPPNGVCRLKDAPMNPKRRGCQWSPNPVRVQDEPGFLSFISENFRVPVEFRSHWKPLCLQKDTTSDRNLTMKPKRPNARPFSTLCSGPGRLAEGSFRLKLNGGIRGGSHRDAASGELLFHSPHCRLAKMEDRSRQGGLGMASIWSFTESGRQICRAAPAT